MLKTVYLESNVATDIDVNLIGDQAVEQFQNNHPASVVTYDNDYYGDKSTTEVASYVPSNNDAQMGCLEWSLNPTYTTASFTNGFPYGFSSGSQSDGDITPTSGSVIDGASRRH